MTDVVQFLSPRGEERKPPDQPTIRQDQAVANRQINLRWLPGVLRRRKVILTLCVAVIPVITAFIVFNLTPVYMAQSRLLIESVREPTLDIKTAHKDITFNLSDVETEAEVIRSREFARHALGRLNLLDNPAFNPALNPKVKKSPMAVWHERYVNEALAWIGGKAPLSLLDKLARTPPAIPDLPRTKEKLTEDAIDKLMDGTVVIPAAHARVITIQQTSSDAEFAARAANTIAEIYVGGGYAQKVKAIDRTLDRLTDRVDEIRNLVLDSQRKLEEFRNSTGIVEAGDATLLRQQILQLNQTLLDAETKRARIRARYERARAFLKSPEGLDSAGNVLNSKLINDMRLKETQLQIKLTELRSRYRSRYPKVIQTRKQIAKLKVTISDEIKKIVARLETEAGISNTKVNRIRSLVADLEGQFRYEREAEATIRALTMEVNANKQLYDVLLERLREANFKEAPRQRAKARIISRAITPHTPIFPRTWTMIFASVLIALILGVLIGVGREYLIPGYRTLVELQKDAGLPVLSIVPLEADIRQHNRPMFRLLAERPDVSRAESMRKLHAGLAIADYSHPCHLLAVTSTLHGEGKTSTVLGLAAVSIQARRRVLVIDCDMRRPNIHLQLSVDNTIGMSDLLSGRAKFDDVIELDLQSGIHYITAGRPTNNADDLVNSEIMDQLIEYAGRQFNLLIFNTPPVLSAYDPLVVLPKVDQTVFCVKWERTPKKLVKRALRLILETGARMPGAVLTHVDLNIQRMVYGHDYTYYYYYSSRLDRSA